MAPPGLPLRLILRGGVEWVRGGFPLTLAPALLHEGSEHTSSHLKVPTRVRNHSRKSSKIVRKGKKNTNVLACASCRFGR